MVMIVDVVVLESFTIFMLCVIKLLFCSIKDENKVDKVCQE